MQPAFNCRSLVGSTECARAVAVYPPRTQPRNPVVSAGT